MVRNAVKRAKPIPGLAKWLIIAGGVLLLLVVVLVVLFSFKTPPALLYAEDVFCLPDNPPELVAWLKLLNPVQGADGLYGQRLDFYSGAEKLGSDLTNDSGKSTLKIKPMPRGNYRLEVRTAPDSPYRNAAAPLTLLVRNVSDPLVIVSVGGALTSVPESAWTAAADVPAAPDAARVLDRAVRDNDWALVYLTNQDKSFIPTLRAWLDAHRFPPGVIIVHDSLLKDLSEPEFKFRTARRLRTAFPNTVLAVGSSLDDARAFVNAGLRTVILNPDPQKTWPPGIISADAWAPIYNIITPALTAPPPPDHP